MTIPTASRRIIAGTSHRLRREAGGGACGGVSFESGIRGLTQVGHPKLLFGGAKKQEPEIA
jgi:hypothetical protein